MLQSSFQEDTRIEPEELADAHDMSTEDDEFLIKLLEENIKFRELLKLALDGFEFISKNFGCAGCQDDWKGCPFNTGNKDECTELWKYANEIVEVLNGNDAN